MTFQRIATGACFLASGIVLFQIAVWFSMVGVWYSPKTHGFPFQTASWFVLGQMVILPFSIAYAGIFLLVSRWVRWRVSWFAMVSISAILIVLGVHAAQPSNQLRLVIGPVPQIPLQ